MNLKTYKFTFKFGFLLLTLEILKFISVSSVASLA